MSYRKYILEDGRSVIPIGYHYGFGEVKRQYMVLLQVEDEVGLCLLDDITKSDFERTSLYTDEIITVTETFVNDYIDIMANTEAYRTNESPSLCGLFLNIKHFLRKRAVMYERGNIQQGVEYFRALKQKSLKIVNSHSYVFTEISGHLDSLLLARAQKHFENRIKHDIFNHWHTQTRV